MCVVQLKLQTKLLKILEEIKTSPTLTDINQIVYATASTITEQIGIGPKKYKKTNSRKRKYLPGKQKSSKIFKEMKWFINPVGNAKGPYVPYVNQEEKNWDINQCYKIKNAVDMVPMKELLKQQTQAKAQRIQRFI